jgi:hypothetical protein
MLFPNPVILEDIVSVGMAWTMFTAENAKIVMSIRLKSFQILIFIFMLQPFILYRAVDICKMTLSQVAEYSIKDFARIL